MPLKEDVLSDISSSWDYRMKMYSRFISTSHQNKLNFIQFQQFLITVNNNWVCGLKRLGVNSLKMVNTGTCSNYYLDNPLEDYEGFCRKWIFWSIVWCSNCLCLIIICCCLWRAKSFGKVCDIGCDNLMNRVSSLLMSPSGKL